LHAAFVEGRFAFGAVGVPLDNFPGTVGQLELLAEIAGLVGVRLAVLEVRAEVTTVVARVAQRRMCPGCGPDAHAPAVPVADDIDQCGSCGTELTRRASDVPRQHRLRLARYATNLPEITELARERSIPHVIVNADQDGYCASHSEQGLTLLRPARRASPKGQLAASSHPPPDHRVDLRHRPRPTRPRRPRRQDPHRGPDPRPATHPRPDHRHLAQRPHRPAHQTLTARLRPLMTSWNRSSRFRPRAGRRDP
jgi:adenylate kinase family enzyme